MNASQQLMTVEDVSDYLRVPVTTLYQWRWLKTGPPAIKVGKHLRYRLGDLEAWLDGGAQSQAADARQNPAVVTGTPRGSMNP